MINTELDLAIAKSAEAWAKSVGLDTADMHPRFVKEWQPDQRLNCLGSYTAGAKAWLEVGKILGVANYLGNLVAIARTHGAACSEAEEHRQTAEGLLKEEVQKLSGGGVS